MRNCARVARFLVCPRSTAAEEQLRRRLLRCVHADSWAMSVRFARRTSNRLWLFGADSCFRPNFPLYSVPRAWLRMLIARLAWMAGRTLWIVMEWGDSSGAPFLSAAVWGEGNILGRPAIWICRSARPRCSFNSILFTGHESRGHRLVWNAILNCRIVSAPAPKHESASMRVIPWATVEIANWHFFAAVLS